MIYKMVSSKAVIAKVIADLGMDEDDIKITDIQEWIGEAVSKIGSVNQLDHKVVNIPLKGYQAKLPCDLEKLNTVAFSFCDCGGWLPMRKTTSAFSVYSRSCEQSCCDMLVQDEALIPMVKNMFNLTNDRQALDKLNEDDNLRSTLSALLNQYTVCSSNGKIMGVANNTNFSNSLQYDIKPGYIFCNIPEGWLKLSYYATYTDEEGMPMIPDNPSYFEAIYWYVAMKLLYIEYFKGNKPQHIYYDAKSSWNFYRKQAYAESLMPNADEIESIKNTWTTLVPEVMEHDTFFSATGDRQHIYNQNFSNLWK